MFVKEDLSTSPQFRSLLHWKGGGKLLGECTRDGTRIEFEFVTGNPDEAVRIHEMIAYSIDTLKHEVASVELADPCVKRVSKMASRWKYSPMDDSPRRKQAREVVNIDSMVLCEGYPVPKKAKSDSRSSGKEWAHIVPAREDAMQAKFLAGMIRSEPDEILTDLRRIVLEVCDLYCFSAGIS